MQRQHHSRHGFTLIELSIVLVIIGFIVGGVLMGKDMIRSAKFRSVISDHERILTGISAFKLKYGCMPGDCATATRFFGSAGGTGLANDYGGCLSPAHTNQGSTGTCNGNGNNYVSSIGEWGMGGLDDDYERYLIWQHLGLARFIPRSYGTQGVGISYGHQGDVNSPRGKLENSIWAVHRPSAPVATSITGKQVFYFGMDSYNSGGYWNAPGVFLSAPETNQIDTKFDDGLPFTGRIIAFYIVGGNECVTNPVTIASTYRTVTTNLANGCGLIFPSGF